MSYTGIKSERIKSSNYGMFTPKGGRLLSNRLARFNDRLYEIEKAYDDGDINSKEAIRKIENRTESLFCSFSRLSNNPPKYAYEVIDTDVRDQFYGMTLNLLASSPLFERDEARSIIEKAKDNNDLF